VWLLAFFIWQTAMAQDALPHRVFNVNDGLVQQQVKALYKDSRGYLWIGTLGGVSKFNGETFENFTQRDGLISNFIIGFEEDTQGNILIITVKGISVYDGRQFTSYPSPGKLHFLNSSDEEGRLWLSQARGPLLLFDGRKFVKASEIISGIPEKEIIVMVSVPENDVRILTNDQGTSWIWSAGKLEKLGERTPSFSVSPISVGKKPYAVIWRGEGKTRSLVSLGPNGVVPVMEMEGDNVSFTFDYRVKYFYFLNRGDNIIYQLDPVNGTKKPLHHNFKEQINAAWPDSPAHTTWIGTDHGLIQVFEKGFRQLKHPLLNWPWAVQEDATGQYWIANYKGGLVRYDGASFEQVAGYKKKDFPQLNFYYGISKDKRGYLFFPNQYGLLERSSAGDFNLHTFSLKGVSGFTAELLSRYDPVDDKILIAAYRRLIVFDPVTGAHDSIPHSGGLHEESYCLSVVRDSFNNYWAGSGYGLSRHHLPSGQSKHFLPEEGMLPVDGILCMQPDHRGALWMGSSGGLGVWDYEGDSLNLIEGSNLRATISNLALIDSTWLSVGTMDGVYLLHLPTYHREGRIRLRHYNHRNGFLGIEPEQNGSFVDSRGRLWIIASDGVYYIPKEELSLEKAPASVRVTRINDQRLAFQEYDQIQKLPFDVNYLKIEFENIGPTSSMHPEFSWKLEGVDEKFTPWTNNTTAMYNSLGPGAHSFLLRTRDPSAVGEKEHAETRVELRLSMLPWRAPNFYLWASILIIVSAGIAYFFFRRQRRARQDLEKRERLIKYYQVQTLQSQLNPHFLRNLITNIQGCIEEEDSEEAVEQLLRMADMMDNFIETNVPVQSNGRLRGGDIPLKKEIKLLKYYLDFQELIYPTVFSYTLEIDEDVQLDRERVPPMIIQPFVENAIEHGLRNRHSQGHLWLRFFYRDYGLICTVEDNGIGIAAAEKLKQSSEQLYESRGTDLVMERVEVLRDLNREIFIDIGDRPGGGTFVRIEFARA